MKARELALHTLFRVVTEDAQRLIAAHKQAGLDPDSVVIDEQEFYIHRVGHAFAHLLTWAEQLEDTLTYLSNYKYGAKSSGTGGGRAKHALYMVENYLIRLQSIYDRCLQLVNCVFNLCIEDSNVGHAVIVSNLKVARTNVPNLLKQVKRSIKPHEQHRHTIIHRNSYQEKDLDRLQLFYMFDRDTWQAIGSPGNFDDLEEVRKDLLRRTLAEKKKEFALTNEGLMKVLCALMDGLQPQYEKFKAQIGSYA
ncbi:Cthe_2314 family HEPN domain-containing protein [Paracidovorax citrulli]